jgi:hypothetical protein
LILKEQETRGSCISLNRLSARSSCVSLKSVHFQETTQIKKINKS